MKFWCMIVRIVAGPLSHQSNFQHSGHLLVNMMKTNGTYVLLIHSDSVHVLAKC